MQDEKNASTSQSTSNEELAERLITLINHTGDQLASLLKEIGSNEGAMRNFFDKVDKRTLGNAEVLRQFTQVIMQGAAVEMLRRAEAEMKRGSANCKDVLGSTAEQMGFDVQIIEFGGIIP